MQLFGDPAFQKMPDNFFYRFNFFQWYSLFNRQKTKIGAGGAWKSGFFTFYIDKI